MRKVIEMNREYLIECDNKNCDFKILNPTKSVDTDLRSYINMPCPKCGENLLTIQDYLTDLKFLKTVKWVNKWFSWITIFIPKKYEREYTAKAYNGLKIEEQK